MCLQVWYEDGPCFLDFGRETNYDYGITVSSMGDLVLATVNAIGLKQNMKRLAMFPYFKQQHYDIICLQETHLTKQDIPIWEKQWGGKIIYVEGIAHSQGEMILIF